MQSQSFYPIVVTSPNDSRGGNIMKRMRLYLSGLIQQVKAFGGLPEATFQSMKIYQRLGMKLPGCGFVHAQQQEIEF